MSFLGKWSSLNIDEETVLSRSVSPIQNACLTTSEEYDIQGYLLMIYES